MNVRPATIAFLLILFLDSPALPIETSGHYRDFWKWSTLATVHVDLHYPDGMEDMAVRAAEIAESAYVRVSNHLGHEPGSIIPVLVYPEGHYPAGSSIAISNISQSDPEQIMKQGFIVVAFNGSYADLQNSMTRMMTHVFIVSLAGEKPWHYAAIRSARIPYGIAEGMAHYLSRGFDATAEMEIRHAMGGNRFFAISNLRDMPGVSGSEASAEWQAFCLFLEKRFGKGTLGELIRGFLDTRFYDDAFTAATGKSLEDLEREWATFLLDRYSHDISARETGKIMRGISAPPGIMIPSPSPDGTKLAALSGANGVEKLMLLDFTTGRRTGIRPLKTLLRGSRWGCLRPSIARDNRISWSPDGRTIVLAGISRDRPSLVFLDAATGRIILTRPLPFTVIKDPALSPDGRFVAFSGVAGSAENIYLWDREKDTVARITDDEFSDRFPVMTTDGGSVIFSTNWNPGGNPARALYRIHQIDIKTGRRTELAPGSGCHIQADLSPDGKKLLFVSDRSGLQRLYIYNITSKSVSRLSDNSEGPWNPRWLGGTGSFLFIRRKNSATEIAIGSTEGGLTIDSSSREADLLPVTYKEPYVDPRGYAFQPYQPRLRTGWLHLGATGTMNNSYLCYLQGGLTDHIGRHRLVLEATYGRVPHKNDLNATLAYNLRMGRTTLGLGLFRQSNPLAIQSPDELSDLSSEESFGILGMEHYGGYLSARVLPVKFFILSMAAYSGRLEKEYGTRDMRHDLRMTYGRVTLKAEYNTEQRGLIIPVRGSRFQVVAEHSFDFTGKNSYTRLGIDLRHRFLLGRQFMLLLRGAGATLAGANHGGFQFFLGGFNGLRGYGLNTIPGRNMFLFNAELRFTPAGWLTFGTNLKGGPGTIGFVVFFDAGSAWNGRYRFVDKKTGRLDDLKMDFGLGVRFAVSPLLILKLDFAWPFDNKSIRQTSMVFGVGFDY